MIKQQNGDCTHSYRTVTLSCLTCAFLLLSEIAYLITQRTGKVMSLFPRLILGIHRDLALMFFLIFGGVKTSNLYFHRSAQLILGFALASIIGNFVLFACFGADLNIHMIRFLFALNANDSMYFSKNVQKMANTSKVLLLLCSIAAFILSYTGILYYTTVSNVILKKFRNHTKRNSKFYGMLGFISIMGLLAESLISDTEMHKHEGDSYHYRGLRVPLTLFAGILSGAFKPDANSVPTFNNAVQLQPSVGNAHTSARRLSKKVKVKNETVPNVLFIVLESVGSNVVETHMPYLHSISRKTKAFEFSRVYTESPNTLKSMIQLLCGFDVIYDSIGWSEYEKYNLRECLPSQLVENFNFSTGLFTPVDLETHRVTKEQRKLIGFQYEFAEYDAQKIHDLESSKDFRLIDPSINWMVKQSSKKMPFFASMFPSMTHAPYTSIIEDKKGLCKGHYEQVRGSHEPFMGPPNSDKVLYLKAVHCADFWLKSYLEKLKKQPFFNDTLVVIVGDHGESFGEESDGQYFHGGSVSEAQIHVPLTVIPHLAFFKKDTVSAKTMEVVRHQLHSLSDVPNILLMRHLLVEDTLHRVYPKRQQVRSYAFFNPGLQAYVYNNNFKLVYTNQNKIFSNLAWSSRVGGWSKIDGIHVMLESFKLYNITHDDRERVDLLPEILKLPGDNIKKMLWVAEMEKLLESTTRNNAKQRRLAAGAVVRVSNAADSNANGDYTKSGSTWIRTVNSVTYQISYNSVAGEWRLRRQGSSSWITLNTVTAASSSLPPASGWSGSMSVTDVSGSGGSTASGPSPSSSGSPAQRSQSAYNSPSPASSHAFTPSAAVHLKATEKSNSELSFTAYTHGATTALLILCLMI